MQQQEQAEDALLFSAGTSGRFDSYDEVMATGAMAYEGEDDLDSFYGMDDADSVHEYMR